MKIVSLNAWHGKQEKALREFLNDERSTTDVFCFQEASGTQIELLFADMFPPSDYHQITVTNRLDDQKAAICLTTFIRKNIEIIDQFEPLEGIGDAVGYCLVTRLRCGAEGFLVANTHGVAYPGDKLDTSGRLSQSDTIIKALERYDGAKIICGDFNLDPSTESVRMFERAGYENLISGYDIATTRNELAWSRFPDNKQLFADYVFVAPAGIVRDFTVPQNLASDHLPLVIEIAIATAKDDAMSAVADKQAQSRA